jgi:hypothetical protein
LVGPFFSQLIAMTREKILKVARTAGGIVLGLLAFIWFRWTPQTAECLVGFVCLTLVVAIIAILVSPKHEEYWPKPESEGLLYRPPDAPQQPKR